MKIKFIVALFLVISCQRNREESIDIDQVITFDQEHLESIAEDIDSIMYFPLESHQNAYYSNSSKVVFRNNKIFIGDFFQHKIVVYNHAGQFLYTINNRGRASNEYLEIKNFCVTDHEIAIIDNVNHVFKTYDIETGYFIENKPLPFVAWDVEWLADGRYVFAFSPLLKNYNPNKSRYRLFFTDNDLNITKKLFPYKEDEIDPIGKMTYFSLSQERVLFHWCGADYFAVIDRIESDSIKIVAVEFGDKKIPDEYKGNMEKINQGGFYYMSDTPVANRNYIAFDIAAQHYSDCYLYSIEDNIMKRNDEDENIGMPFPLCIDEEGRFIDLLNGPEEYEMYVKDGFPRASKEVEEHIKNGGVTILRYVTK